ncbi:MAG: outer-membrane lipoprotein carrier protein LolA [Prevotella sp.]|nr:outer-membrane lipoprotein carrier protein LolA [Prevotella sp.]
MRRIKVVLFIFALCSTVLAATNPDATKILDKTAKKISIRNGVRMNFSVTSPKFSQSGTLVVKGQKFHATTANAEIWYDGKTQWTYNKASDEVNIANPSASVQQSMNPYYFLNLYKQKGYQKTATADSKGYNVHLSGKGKNISEMYITVDKSYNLKQVKIKQGSQWITISVSNIRSTSTPDASFRFSSKEHPKAEVIDLR